MARIGFKAGALQEGFLSPSASAFGYFALFDADFQPKPDFLTSLMPRFKTGFVSGGDPKDDAALQNMFDRSSWTTTDPGNVGRGRIGCVQGRWGFLNAEQNMLTRLQYLVLQTHHCIEQHYRCRSGLLMTFNGTGGIWTRECIEQTGGWTFETVCEDLLLSYRAQIRGFRVVYARDVVIPSELPPTLGVFLKQQQRWARGTTQSAKLIIPSLWKAQHLSFGQKAYGTVHLLGYFFFAVFVSVETLGQLLNVPFPLPLLVLLTSMCPLLTQFVMMREIRQMRILLLLPIFYCISQGIQLCVSLSTFYGLFDSVARPGKFTRTPKGQLSSPTKRSKSWWKSVQLLRYEIYLVALWTIHGLMFTAMSFQGVILSIIGIAYYVAAGLDC
jgi:cellulose synthase/poly-beta-1,6-N-acetylglucosamine synthase-like glycosyltransferase